MAFYAVYISNTSSYVTTAILQKFMGRKISMLDDGVRWRRWSKSREALPSREERISYISEASEPRFPVKICADCAGASHPTGAISFSRRGDAASRRSKSQGSLYMWK
ncbi:unnamed protein product [Fusarium fujikuroi]|nr:uncharacterized protein FFC1_10616 [Fusarium fujikuroi]VTT67726.1 unnamed protein product [Fusarium fujikuroi]